MNRFEIRMENNGTWTVIDKMKNVAVVGFFSKVEAEKFISKQK